MFGPGCKALCNTQGCQLPAPGNTSCHHVRGSCLLGCQTGFTGETCAERKDDDSGGGIF